MFKPHQKAYNAIYGAKNAEINSNYFNPYQTSNDNYGKKVNSINSNIGMSNQSYGTMKQHLNNRNIRRIEPDIILKDYRTSSNSRYGNFGNSVYSSAPKFTSKTSSAPIYSTQTNPCEGEEALKRVQARVQESLRKRGCIVAGNKVKMVKNQLFTNSEKPVIDKILQNAGNGTGLKRKQVDSVNQGLLLAAKAALPPSKRKENNKKEKITKKIEPVEKIEISQKISCRGDENLPKNEASPGKIIKKSPTVLKREESSEYVYKNLTSEEDKENEVNQNNLSVFGHTTLSKMNARCIKEDIKKEQNNKRVYKYGDGAKSSQGNPLQADMEKHNKLSKEVQEKTGCYTTTNGSTYKRWQRSAFQTVTSRLEERPYWANPNVGGHFVRSLNKNKKIENASNITLSVTGNNLYKGNKNKRNSNILGNSNTKKNTFKSEYMRTFDDRERNLICA